jgi:hypothetical protein
MKDITLNDYLNMIRIAAANDKSNTRDNIDWSYNSEEKEYFVDMFTDATKHWKKSNKALFEYKLGGVTQEDINNGNYESQYIWFTLNTALNAINSNKMFMVKSGHSWDDAYDTIEDTSSRESQGEKIPLAVYYYKKRNSNKPLDEIYHDKMLADDWLMPYYGRNRESTNDGGSEFVGMLTPDMKLEYVMMALGTNEVETGVDFYPDFEQYTIADKWSKRIDNHITEKNKSILKFGIFWKPRKGKTPGTLNVFQESKKLDILIAVSRMGNVGDEWINNSEKFSQFKMFGTTFNNFVEGKYNNIYNYNKLVLASTIQMFERMAKIDDDLSSFNDEEEFNKLDPRVKANKIKLAKNKFKKEIEKHAHLFKGKNIALACDEAHNGTLAVITKMIIEVLAEVLDIKIVFDITGTGQKLYAFNAYEEDCVSEYTLADEIRLRNIKMQQYGITLEMLEEDVVNIIKSIDFNKDPDARVLMVPVYKSYYASVIDIIPEDIRNGMKEFPPFAQMLNSENSVDLPLHKNLIIGLVSYMFGLGSFREKHTMFGEENPFYNKGFINESNVYDYRRFAHMAFVDQVKYGRNIQSIIETTPQLNDNIDVINICGNEDNIKNIDMLNKSIRKSIAKGKYVLVLSSQMYGTGATLDMVRFVHHLNDGSEFARKYQNGLRGQSTLMGHEIIAGKREFVFKKNAIDVYYNMGQFFKITWDKFSLVDNVKKGGNHFTITQNDICNYIFMRGVSLSEINLNEMIDWIRESGDTLRGYGTISAGIDFDGLNESYDLLSKYERNLTNQEKKELKKQVNENEINNTDVKLKSKTKEDDTNDNNNESVNLDKIRKQIVFMLSKIIDFVVDGIMNESTESFSDVIEINELDFEILFSEKKIFLYGFS